MRAILRGGSCCWCGVTQQFSEGLVKGVALVETRHSGAETVLGSEEFRERAVDLISDDFLVGDEDVLEDGLVEFAPCFIACAHVEGVGADASAMSKWLANDESEERRVFYVGASRAKKLLALWVPASRIDAVAGQFQTMSVSVSAENLP